MHSCCDSYSVICVSYIISTKTPYIIRLEYVGSFALLAVSYLFFFPFIVTEDIMCRCKTQKEASVHPGVL